MSHTHKYFHANFTFFFHYRVCKKWNECTKCPALWKKVDIKLFRYISFRNKSASLFFKNLPSSVSYMKLDFEYCIWRERLNFEDFCVMLRKNCPHLHTLILHRALISVSISSLIDLCSVFLPNLKALILPESVFGNDCKERKYGRLRKMEVLDISDCLGIQGLSKCSLSKMNYLKKLNLSGTFETDNWFNIDDISFLRQLEFLHLGKTDISLKSFRMLQNHAVNLTELFLCATRLEDSDFIINNSVFPHLKTICLRHCRRVTCEGIISLVQACQSLQNIYVDRGTVENYAKHPFIIANVTKLGIVKAAYNCIDHYEKLDYLLD